MQETLDCVHSICQNIDTKLFHIIIVDNGSSNGVFEQLRKETANNARVSCISSGGNLGFAKGNNVGISYARENYFARFICCLNNDTLLEQKDFFQQLSLCYEKNYAAVIGPQIILRNREIQPLCAPLASVNAYKMELKKYMTNNISLKLRIKRVLVKVPCFSKLNKVRHRLYCILQGNNKKNVLLKKAFEENRDCILHGSCIIFTPMFFSKLFGFNPKTFMFREEELLFLAVQRAELHTFYEPNLKIRHLEDVSTDAVYQHSKEKEVFLRKNQIKSLEVLIKELSENPGEEEKNNS